MGQHVCLTGALRFISYDALKHSYFISLHFMILYDALKQSYDDLVTVCFA